MVATSRIPRELPSEGRGRKFESCRARHWGASLNKPLKSPEQLGRMLWEALRAEQPAGFRECSIRVVRTKAGSADWDAELVTGQGSADGALAAVFAKAKAALQKQYGWRDD
jgi:hypothetical protein